MKALEQPVAAHHTDLEECIDRIIERVGPRLVVGTPLGLGKANLLLNGLYSRARSNPELSLTIITALTLEVPRPGSELESRFLKPVLKRWFDGYPQLAYAQDRATGRLPDNVRVQEFFLAPGKYLNNSHAQQNYISSNYTHVARDMLSRGVNVVVQMVSPGQGDRSDHVSLSCNSDVTLELVPKMRTIDRPVIIVGELNDQLPYMLGDADVDKNFFDALYEPPTGGYRLFNAPKESVATRDYMIGLHAGALVRDNGTLQVGIGSLGDAVAYSLGKRHEENQRYRQLISEISNTQTEEIQNRVGDLSPFEKGLYGATEMFVDGFLYLFDKGILSRRVYEDLLVQKLLNEGHIEERISADTLDVLERHQGFTYPLTKDSAGWLRQIGLLKPETHITDKTLEINHQCVEFVANRDLMREFIINIALGDRLADPSVLHGGFYIGNEDFYERLRTLPAAHRSMLKMTSVERINQLYRGEARDRIQRLNARFINTCLMVTLNGTVVSDGLDNTRVLSGVGGQYNFVAMAHALDHSRSIIKLRSTWEAKEGLRSNIVFNYANATIPRHLRDIVVTEYGVADLRGRSDAECAAALINIADSRFQDELLEQARANDKLPVDYQIDAEYRNNTPQRLEQQLHAYRQHGWFEKFPLGSDLEREEIELAVSLRTLKENTATFGGKIASIYRAIRSGSPQGKIEMLSRLQLDEPVNIKERLLQRLVASVLPD